MTLSKRFRETGLLTTKQAAAALGGVHRSSVWLWIDSGVLPFTRVGGFIGIKQSDLDAFKKAWPHTSKEAPKSRVSKTKNGKMKTKRRKGK